jgi:transcriptional regulator with XRE-family HTH domain
MDALVRLRADAVDKYRAVAKLARDQDLADAMGCSRQTVTRTFAGRTELSASFIAGLLTVFNTLAFNDLFEVVDGGAAEQTENAASAASAA